MGVFSAESGLERARAGRLLPGPQSGLKAIIAIYSTALGPALGGTRFYPYASEADALHDALDLSRAMAYKNALAGLDLGGGKARHLGRPGHDQDRGAAARVRPLRRVARRPLLHRLRRRHLRRRHGRRRPRDPLRHRPQRRARRRRRLVRPHRVGRVPGHAGGGRALWGTPDAGRPPGRHRRRRQGRPAPHRAPARGRRRRGRAPTSASRRSTWAASTYPQVDWSRTRPR